MGIGLLAASLAASAPASPVPPRVERVVMLMRHGVRPPTKDPAMPPGVAVEPWPVWSVPPGNLTAHGAAAVRLLGAADRRRLVAQGLLPARNCPEAGAVRLISDSDQRTIATGDAWATGLAAACNLANRHRAQGAPDPLFSNAGENGERFDPARADAAVRQELAPGGVAAAEEAQRTVLMRLDRILCGRASSSCGVAGRPSRLVTAERDKRPKLDGALDRGSTAAQIMLLEYAEGMPMQAVGWGRATARDITLLSALHSAEFQILARPPYLASVNAAPLARRMLEALGGKHQPRVTMLIGHDTNIASLSGMLGLHWQVPGFAADDPPPGGGIVLELVRDRAGRRFVRAGFRSQSLDQIRSLAPPPARLRRIAIPGCGALCPLDRFRMLVTRRLTDAGL